MPTLLQMRNICKNYPGVVALSEINFDLSFGEIHCLLGENGAGKSTLMKILSAAIRKDSGSIFIQGKEFEFHPPTDAQEQGIGMIYQEFKLVPELTVAENIFLGNEPTKGKSPFIDYKKMQENTSNLLAQLGEKIPTTAMINSLSVAQRQMVEIAKALSRKVKILIMDEPSTSLSQSELKGLFSVIHRLKKEGVGIIYISHRLEEFLRLGINSRSCGMESLYTVVQYLKLTRKA